MSDRNFWAKIDALVERSTVVIDRPKGSRHPRIPTMIYPLDYGFLSDTTSTDGHGVDVWIGSLKRHTVTGVVCTVDLDKRDAELKILVGCTRPEQQRILSIHNFSGGTQGGILISRRSNAPQRGRQAARQRGANARARSASGADGCQARVDG